MTITNVNWYSAGLQVVISGSGFGNRAPYAGNADFIEVHNNSSGLDAGHTGDFYGLNVISWTDTQIIFFYNNFSAVISCRVIQSR